MEKFTAKLFILILVVFCQNISVKNENMCDLPAECKYIKYEKPFRGNFTFGGILCDNKFDEKMISVVNRTLNGCIKLFSADKVYISIKHDSKREIVDKSFEVFKLRRYNTMRVLYLNFLKVNGFDIESSIALNDENYYILKFYSGFNLYKRKRLVNDCQDYNAADSNHSHGFIFRKYVSWFWIVQPKSIHPICTLFFRNTLIATFYLEFLVNTYFKRYMVTFTDLQSSNEDTLLDYNLRIGTLRVINSYNIDLNSKFLNKYLFANTGVILFDCNFNSIQVDVFKPFKKLKRIDFDTVYMLEFIRKNGIEWIKSINSDVNVNMTNIDELSEYNHRIVNIFMRLNTNMYELKLRHLLFEKDFCLFVDFPFKQLILIVPFYFDPNKYQTHFDKFICTEVWLFQYFLLTYISSSSIEYNTNFANILKAKIKACKFDHKLTLCKKTNYHRLRSNATQSVGKFTFTDFILVIELSVVIVSPFLGVFGIATNLLTIYVIFHKKNVKTMRENHYMYICLNCTSNATICFIQIFNLISECQYPIGIYCSSIRQFIVVQYLNIIFGEYMSSVCRLLSNFYYLSFSLCRMFKIGKDHGKLIVFMNNFGIKKYIAISVLISAGLSVCKALQFDLNVDIFEFAFPIHFIQNSFRNNWFYIPGYVAIMIINAIYDILNYFVFVIVHLVVDLVLVKKLKNIIKEREGKMLEMMIAGSKSIEKASKENEEAKRRTLFMVVSNSMLNFLTKVPLMITSLNDVRVIFQKIQRKQFNQNTTFFRFSSKLFTNFCLEEKSCLAFRNFSNCVFLVSLGSTFFFLKSFDKNFKEAYAEVFDSKSLQNTQSLKNEIFT